SWWFYGSREAFAKADKSNMVSVDVGTYLPKRGLSVPEIAATSRSQHKSQGFGSSGSRGALEEYLELVAGDLPTGATDPFAGINTTWTRVEGGAVVSQAIDTLLARFDFEQPENNLSALLEIRRLIQALPDGHWKSIKLSEAEQLIAATTGLFLEVVADSESAAPGQPVTLKVEAINRSHVPIKLHSIRFKPFGEESLAEVELATNIGYHANHTFNLPTDVDHSSAYWLNKQATLGMYAVADQRLRGMPESPAAASALFDLAFYDEARGSWEPLVLEREVVFKTTDPVKGEVYSPFEISPPVFVQLDEPAYIFAQAAPQEVVVKVIAGRDSISGTVELCHPENWTVAPDSYPFTITDKNQEATFNFKLSPPEEQGTDYIVPLVKMDAESYTDARIVIDYDHIPKQTIVKDASARVVRLDIKRAGQHIGYLMGTGDDIPQALEQIGYSVTLLEDRDMTPERLAQFDAVILGVRAYNTVDRMPVYQPILMDYVKKGGTLIVQYNTNRRLKVDMEDIAPYPLKISRDRVTVEEAEVRILAPDHPVINTPNQITQADFAGWVQERGLYFPDEWDEAYTPILSSNDPGEPARDGGLLVAPYGQGWYVYTGYSWFRELPAGVPGAYRLFTNLISLGNQDKP
ncbi:MAG: LmbE family protein, partial [Bacteroidetes bacterium]